MASEIARLYNSGCSDGDQVELAALLEKYMGEDGSGDSSSESEVEDSIVSSDEEADFDLRPCNCLQAKTNKFPTSQQEDEIQADDSATEIDTHAGPAVPRHECTCIQREEKCKVCLLLYFDTFMTTSAELFCL